MKKEKTLLILGTVAIILIVGWFYIDSQPKTSYEEFVERCENTGGEILIPIGGSGGSGYTICKCIFPPHYEEVYYKDIKNINWDGCGHQINDS